MSDDILAERMLDVANRLAEAERAEEIIRSGGPDHEPLTVADLQRAHDALAESSWDRLADLLDVRPVEPPPAPHPWTTCQPRPLGH